MQLFTRDTRGNYVVAKCENCGVFMPCQKYENKKTQVFNSPSNS